MNIKPFWYNAKNACSRFKRQFSMQGYANTCECIFSRPEGDRPSTRFAFFIGHILPSDK